MNRSGHGFDAAVVRPWPAGAWPGPDWKLDVMDLTGRGGPTALLRGASSAGGNAMGAWGIDIGQPFALRMCATTNHRGCLTRVCWRSAAQEWLDEKKAADDGQGPRYPFVGALVKRVTIRDDVAGQACWHEHAYRMGHFDVERRLFRGFRNIETVTCTDAGPYRSIRCWYFTGCAEVDAAGPGRLKTLNRAPPRFTEWSATQQHDVLLAADPAVEESGRRALAGMRQHRETMAWIDATWATTRLEAWRYQVRRIRAERNDAEACWLPLLLESATMAFDDEGSPDTVTSHGICLDYDAFGACRRDIDIVCARPESVAPSSPWERRLHDDSWDDQQRVHACTQTRSLAWHLDDEDRWRPHCPGDVRVDGCRLSVDIVTGTDIAAERFEGSDDPIATATLALLSMECVLYGDSPTPVAPSLAALPTALMVASMDGLARDDLGDVYDGTSLDALLAGAGYVAMQGRLLASGETLLGFAMQRFAYDDAQRFHRVLRASPSGTIGWTHHTYDEYGLFVTRMIDPVDRVTEVAYDYRRMLPWRSVDANGVVRAVAMDAFGATRAETVHGLERDANGDARRRGFDELASPTAPSSMTPAEAIANPGNAVGGLYRRWAADEFAWMADADSRQPVHLVCVTADRYPDDAERRIRCDVDHVDGCGRALRLACSQGDTAAAPWAVTGAIDRYPEGTIQHAYAPFFADGWRHAAPPGDAARDTFTWDQDARCVSRRTALGNVFATTYRCWYTVFRDANCAAGEGGNDAVIAAPRMHAFDHGGRVIRHARYIRTTLEDAGTTSIERAVFATNGVEESSFDARSLPSLTAVRTQSPFLGSGRSWSADHGATWTLRNDRGAPTWTRDALGATRTYDYDATGRLVTEAYGGATPRVALRHVYEPANGTSGSNLASLPWRTYDASGCREIVAASIASMPIRIDSRLLAGDDRPDWTDGAGMEAQLEPGAIRTAFAFDANGLVREAADDRGCRLAFRYTAGGWLDGVNLFVGGDEHVLVASAERDAAGRCVRMTTGGGMIRRWEYDADGRRVRTLAHARGGAIVQDVSRTFDRNGNLVTLKEESGRQRAYQYDSVGRLLLATGHEHPQASDDGELPPLITGAVAAGDTRPYTRRFVHDVADNLIETIHAVDGFAERRMRMTVAPLSNRAVPTASGVPGDGVDACFDAAGRLAHLWPSDTPLSWSPDGPLAGVGVAGSEHHERHLRDAVGRRRRHRWQYDGVSGETRYDVLTQYRTRDLAGYVLLPLALDTGVLRIVVRDDTIDIAHELDDDALVSSRVADASGTIVSTEDYYPYGGTAFRSSRDTATESDKAHRYSHRERDPSGLLDYGVRAYSGWHARWTGPDPAGDFAGLNAYAMVHGNPVNLVDVDGRMTRGERRERERAEATFAMRPDVVAARARFNSDLDTFVLGHLRADGGTALQKYAAYAGYYVPAGSIDASVYRELKANLRHHAYTTEQGGYGRSGFVNTHLPVGGHQGAAPGLAALSSGHLYGDEIEFKLPQRHDARASQFFVSDFDGLIAGVNAANRAVESANAEAYRTAEARGGTPRPQRPATPTELHDHTIDRIRTHVAPHQPRATDRPGWSRVTPLLRVNGVPAAHGEVHALNEANYLLSGTTAPRQVAIFTAKLRPYLGLGRNATGDQVKDKRQAFVACYNCDGIISGADDGAGAIGRITTGRAPDQRNYSYPISPPAGDGSSRAPDRRRSPTTPYSRPTSATSYRSAALPGPGSSGTMHWRNDGAASSAAGRDMSRDRGRYRNGDGRRERDRSRERDRDRSRSSHRRPGSSRR